MTAVVPTVTVPLAEYDRLRGYEQRAKGCKLVIAADRQHLATEKADPKADQAETATRARQTEYAAQFIGYILNEAAK